MKDQIDKGSCLGRREFLVKAGMVAGSLVLTVSTNAPQLLASGFEDITIPIAMGSPLTKIGGSTYVNSSAGKLIVIRSGENSYLAYSAICTHKRGLLGYDHSKKELECPKHGSIFDSANGKVKNGPADDPLASYPASVTGDSVTVKVG